MHQEPDLSCWPDRLHRWHLIKTQAPAAVLVSSRQAQVDLAGCFGTQPLCCRLAAWTGGQVDFAGCLGAMPFCCCPACTRRGPGRSSRMQWGQTALLLSCLVQGPKTLHLGPAGNVCIWCQQDFQNDCSATHTCIQLIMGRLTTRGLAPLRAHLWCCSIWLRHQGSCRLCCGGGGSSAAALKRCPERVMGSDNVA